MTPLALLFRPGSDVFVRPLIQSSGESNGLSVAHSRSLRFISSKRLAAYIREFLNRLGPYPPIHGNFSFRPSQIQQSIKTSPKVNRYHGGRLIQCVSMGK